MTPAQEKALAVALDGLREAFGEDMHGAVREVLREVEPNHDNLLATRVAVSVRERIVGALSDRFQTLGGVGFAAMEWRHAADLVGRIDLRPLIESRAGPFSPPEKPQGVHAPRPQTPPGDTDWPGFVPGETP